jgi:hypothetical protein
MSLHDSREVVNLIGIEFEAFLSFEKFEAGELETAKCPCTLVPFPRLLKV